MNPMPDSSELRAEVAAACRVLAHRGLVNGILGHASARISENEIVVRCRTAGERGLAASGPEDVCRVSLDSEPLDLPDGASVPKELAIHTEIMRARPQVGCVIHAHPPQALLAGLAGLSPRPVFGAYNIPAMRLAQEGVPLYGRSVLITRAELARELVAAMGESSICLMVGHGITVAAGTVAEAVVLAVNLDELLWVTVELARLGVEPPALSEADLAELPDLGAQFNYEMAWQALLAELPPLPLVRG